MGIGALCSQKHTAPSGALPAGGCSVGSVCDAAGQTRVPDLPHRLQRAEETIRCVCADDYICPCESLSFSFL